jgi:hypothetical protein
METKPNEMVPEPIECGGMGPFLLLRRIANCGKQARVIFVHRP